jgi:molybdopterin biosynthesis enzyme
MVTTKPGCVCSTLLAIQLWVKPRLGFLCLFRSLTQGKIMDDLRTQSRKEQEREELIRSLALNMEFISFCKHDISAITGLNLKTFLADISLNELMFTVEETAIELHRLDCDRLANEIQSFILHCVITKLEKDLGIA